MNGIAPPPPDALEAAAIEALGEFSEEQTQMVPPTPQATARRGDMTQGPVLRTLVAFMIPALISNILQTVNGSVNAIWVGQLLGTSAVAATANASMIIFLTFGTVFGFGMAMTISVGRAMGAGEVDMARRSFGGGIGFCLILSTAIAVLGWVYAPKILQLMATPPEIRGLALAYLRITFSAMPFMGTVMMIGMGVRGCGDATTPMYCTLLGMIIDVILNPVLILGLGPFPQLGIAGSALSSVIASLTSAIVMIVLLYVRQSPLRLQGRELVYLIPTRKEIVYMLTKGVPMSAQTLLSTAAGLLFLGLVNREGVLATAAYGASLQLWNYIQMPAMAVGQAASAMVAQNIGAKRHDRVTKVTHAGIAVTLAITGLLGAIVLIFDVPVLGLFLGHGSMAIPVARHIQLVCTWSFILSGVMMVLFATMRAYGSVLLPLLIMFVALYPVRFAFYQWTHPIIGSEAVWWSYPVGSMAALILSVAAYRFGPWRTVRHAQ